MRFKSLRSDAGRRQPDSRTDGAVCEANNCEETSIPTVSLKIRRKDVYQQRNMMKVKSLPSAAGRWQPYSRTDGAVWEADNCEETSIPQQSERLVF
jgi:hypothetical protein